MATSEDINLAIDTADLVRWFQQLCCTGELASAEPKRLRWSLWHTPAHATGIRSRCHRPMHCSSCTTRTSSPLSLACRERDTLNQGGWTWFAETTMAQMVTTSADSGVTGISFQDIAFVVLPPAGGW